MKILLLPGISTVAGLATLLLLPVAGADGQTTVASAPVGYLQTSCLSNSDTLVAPPFTRASVFTGAVSSISGNVVTLANASLTADAFDAPTTTPPTKDTYYLSIGPTTATLGGTVSVSTGSTTVTGTGTSFGNDVNVGDRLTINDGVNLLTYTVTAIASTTSLTIDRAFSDSAATGTNSITDVAGPASAPKAVVVRTGRNVVVTGVAKPVLATAATLSGLSATYDHSPYEGRFYQVTTNATGTITVNLNGDTLASVAAGTQVSVVPYWTLNSVFPAANSGVSFTATTSLFTPQTQILIPDYVHSGVNLSASVIYIYFNSGSNVGWRQVGSDVTVDHGYDPLLPDGYVTVRTPSTAPTLPVTFAGAVPTNKLATTLNTQTSGQQDNAVALIRPADATVGSLGLKPSDASFVTTTSLFTPQDELLVYNNAQTAFNKSASAIYIYYNDGAANVGWRLVGSDVTVDHSGDPVPAASALTIRKAPTVSGQTAVWSNSPNY